ncbi:MAG TPA: MBL fold metallo-hydrolase [Candidatus Paceibacterota bacterium]|jgi:L-ascorbate metabolism protein UlaG (beta-lactamase superfamily)|nr:MBL fold metallo-hydrolase [Candidatus Paceibacterota bacterium]
MIIWQFIKWRFGLGRAQRGDVPKYEPVYATPNLDRIREPDPSKLHLTWIGHSTFLVQVAGMNILTDPIWSERASPMRWLGPKREARPGIRFEDLPHIDVVLVSHTHYDHLDRSTILKLGEAPSYLVPERVGKWFRSEGIENVKELPWWKSTEIGPLKISAVPAKHWSRRRFFGEETAGWGGYVVQTPVATLYFAGDTGYHERYFKDIGVKFPHIDLALIPIGAYFPREVFGRYHVDPREAIQVHREVGAKSSVGMHWGVFRLTQEPLHEPPKLLAKEREKTGVAEESFSTMLLGETRVFG